MRPEDVEAPRARPRARRDAGHAHDHGTAHDHGPAATHDDDGGHGHSHGGGHGHSHAAPDDLSWRSLIALGISGGLLPCPSALVVLLSAVALHRVAFGMALIVAFSLGLAVVISGIGMTVLYARRLFSAPAVRPRPPRRRAAGGERRDHHDAGPDAHAALPARHPT